MKLMVFGSLNVDHVYQVSHFVRAGETLSSLQYRRNAGGKGFNQAVALAKAGLDVWFAGALGRDGLFLLEQLQSLRVHTEDVQIMDVPTGHAMIQVDEQGRNSIVLYGGANQCINAPMADAALNRLEAGDWLLMQNEISCGALILQKAKARGVHVALNPSPMTEELLTWPLDGVDLFILNEVEGADMTGCTQPEEILDAMHSRYPQSRIVLTLGSEGSCFREGNSILHQGIVPVKAVDTTAAGDTFTGFLLSGMLRGQPMQQALALASAAAALAVTRPGAGESVPCLDEVDIFMAQRQGERV